MAAWSVVKKSALVGGLRLDPEYYQPRYLADSARLDALDVRTIGSMGIVTDGIHASPDEVEEGGILYLSAKCVKDNHFVLGDAIHISHAQHQANPRTSLKSGDLLITTVGTIGNAAVVQSEILPANADRHLGIIRIAPKAPVDAYYVATFLNCEYGRFQSLREATGNVQLNLFIEKIRELRIPILDCAAKVSKQTQLAYAKHRESSQALQAAESLLLSALGLDHLALSTSRCYTRSLKDLFTEGRFDAEFFSPRSQAILKQLRKSGITLGDVAPLAERVFNPEQQKKDSIFQYIEIGTLTGHGEAEAVPLSVVDAPSRAQWVVKPGDIITSTVRPIRRLSALIRPDQDGCVCSSGFAVLNPEAGKIDIEPEVLLTYLRLPVVCAVLDLNTTASMYPAIPVDRLLKIPFVVPDATIRTKVVAHVRAALAARRDAARLIEHAKKAIETSIIAKAL